MTANARAMLRVATTLLIPGLAFALNGTTAVAQEPRMWDVSLRVPLRGITEIDVGGGASADSSDDAACTPSNESLRLAASRALLDGGLKVHTGGGAYPTLGISVTALAASPTICAAFVSLRLTAPAMAALGHHNGEDPVGLVLRTPKPRPVTTAYVTAELEASAGLLTGVRTTFEARVLAFVRQTADEIATKIRLANQALP
jgi:hypothetical protein